MKLRNFIMTSKTFRPVEVHKFVPREAFKDHKFNGIQLSMIVFAVLGAIFQDGGIHAVKKLLLKDSYFLEKWGNNLDETRHTHIELAQMGNELSKLLFMKSYYRSTISIGVYFLSMSESSHS